MGDNSTLPLIPYTRAIETANRKIDYYRRESSPGLYSRWPVINKIVGGCFRFGEVTILCGSSGSGKSYLLNMLRDDFLSDINKDYKRNFKILSFSFEMAAEDEVIRTYASKLKTSYSKLVSVDEKITTEQFEKVIKTGETLNSERLYFCETSGNHAQIYNTVAKFYETHECNIIVTMDHTLLASYGGEGNEVELVSNLSRLAIQLKKDFKAMVIFVSQLNDKIEQTERINNPNTHYPQRQDIHGSKSIYMAADNLFIIHRPERLGISKYGPHFYPSKGLVAVHLLKSRLYGTECLLLMKEDFAKGNLIFPWKPDENTETLLL